MNFVNKTGWGARNATGWKGMNCEVFKLEILQQFLKNTLPAEMFGGTEFWLYTIIIIKIESHPF